MWVGVVFVLLAGIPTCMGYLDLKGQEEDEHNSDFYDSYEQDIATFTTFPTEVEALTRIRRYGMRVGRKSDEIGTFPDRRRTLNPDEIHDVKGALKNLFYGEKIGTIPGAVLDHYTDIYDYVEKSRVNDEEQRWIPHGHVSHSIFKSINVSSTKRTTRTTELDDDWLAHEKPIEAFENQNLMPSDEKEILIKNWKPTHSTILQRWRPADTTTKTESTELTETAAKATDTSDTDVTTNTYRQTMPTSLSNAARTLQNNNASNTEVLETVLRGDEVLESRENATCGNGTVVLSNGTVLRQKKKQTPCPTTQCDGVVYPITTTLPPCDDRGSKDWDPRKVPFDIDAIINIIANLTYDYEWDLAKQFNKTLIEHGVPTCPPETTPSTTTTAPPAYDFANTSVVSKCFVCGLKNTMIPREAFCADAFAGDFLPLTPVDPRARGQIASYRKYCRHLDVNNYVENPSEPRSIYGRFTGGCGVRWTDLSGVYTQRTCRNRFKPLMGQHFASKRMAKLELALMHVENGCIISPMASLLPLSRGISLYARFHACVCTGSWCNAAVTWRHMLHDTLYYTLTLCYTLLKLVRNI